VILGRQRPSRQGLLIRPRVVMSSAASVCRAGHRPAPPGCGLRTAASVALLLAVHAAAIGNSPDHLGELAADAGKALDSFLSSCGAAATLTGPEKRRKRLVYLDVGANDGNTSLALVKACNARYNAAGGKTGNGPPRLVNIAFEPQPRFIASHADLVRKAGQLDPPWNVTVMPAAAWVSSESSLDYWVSKKMSTVSSLYQSNTFRWGKNTHHDEVRISVPTIDLAAFLLHNVRPHDDTTYLKLDIESAEFDVIPHLLKKQALCNIDYILVEWHQFAYALTNQTKQRHAEAVQANFEATLRRECGDDEEGGPAVQHLGDGRRIRRRKHVVDHDARLSTVRRWWDGKSVS